MTTRVNELRPLIQEHNRLEDALRALNETGDPATSRAANNKSSGGKPRRTRQEKKAPASTRKRAPRGANREAALSVLRERPGVSSAELAVASGVPRNTLQVLLTRLVKEGMVEKQELPSGRGYALTETRASETQATTTPARDEPTGNPPRA